LTAAIAYVGSRSIHSPFSTDDSNMVIPTLTSAGYLWPCDQTVSGFPFTTPCTGVGKLINAFGPEGKGEPDQQHCFNQHDGKFQMR